MPASQPPHASSTPQVATPTAFPAPGTFGVTERVTLLSATPGAANHYTTDGSRPTTTTSRCRGLTINGVPWRFGAAHPAHLEAGNNHFDIRVTSPDGSVTQTYTLDVLGA